MAKKLISEEKKQQDIAIIKNLKKTFKAKQKEPGFVGSLKSIIRPKYKEVNAVDNISFTIKKGQLLAFLGPNGAGKSTTLKMLTGILFPTSGDVNIISLNPWKDRIKLSYRIGAVFGQKPLLWYHLPPIDTYILLSKIYDIPESEFKKRLDYLTAMFKVKDLLNTPVRKLSLGQRMKCELIAAILHKPEILFLDEPTIGMDVIAKKNFREYIRKLNEEEDLTIILTSHDMTDIEQVCKDVIIINHGRIIFNGKLKDLKNRLKYKVVSILFPQPTKFKELPGVKILKLSNIGVKLQVDTKKMKMAKLFKIISDNYDIEDIIITDPPIEEIIEDIFNAK